MVISAWLLEQRRPGWRRWLGVLLLTAVLVAASYGEAHPSNPHDQVLNGHPVPATPAVAFVLVAVACLVLAWRWQRPLEVLTVSTAAAGAYAGLGYEAGAAMLAPTIALYAVTSRQRLRVALVASALTLAVLMTTTGIGNPFGATGGGFYLIPFLVAAAGFGGIAVANRRAYRESARARVEQEARRRVDEERLRIARELHDVVAHTMATINVQAGVAAHLLADRPDDPAAKALTVIKETSKDGLRELRAILGVLRRADEGEPTEPTPGLEQIPALVAGACRAGLSTELAVEGSACPLPPATELAAYRIVQESLTNAIRHAGPASARVRLAYTADALLVEVTDTGSGAKAVPSPEGSGHGLLGMRERAASVAGTVSAGPLPGGGFRVSARLPAARAGATREPGLEEAAN